MRSVLTMAILVLALGPGLPLRATEAPDPELRPAPLAATEVSAEDYLWEKRLVVVFADTPQDPDYSTQLKALAADPAALAARDIVVIVDSDPAARSALRERLRPRGFQLVLVNKDGSTRLRRPLPWDMREIGRTFDRGGR